MTMRQKWIEKIKAYATEHYEEGGWDYLVEAFDDSQIEEVANKHASYETFFEDMKDWVEVLDDRRADVRATIW